MVRQWSFLYRGVGTTGHADLRTFGDLDEYAERPKLSVPKAELLSTMLTDTAPVFGCRSMAGTTSVAKDVQMEGG